MRLLNWPSWRTSSAAKDTGPLEEPDEDIDEMNLTDEQRESLSQLKKRAGHKVPIHMNSDFEILKWLAARNFDVDEAEKMLLKSMEWRREWNVDSILDWSPPEVLLKYYPVGLTGYDIEGSPVWIVPYGGCDIRGLLHSCTKKDFIRYTIQILEKSLADMRARSDGLEVPIRRQTFIFDLDNFSLKHFAWKPAMDVVLQLVQIYEANYPEILKTAFAINAPKIFTAAFALIKPFLHEVTIKKIKIFGRSGWKEAILKEVSADQLPAHWGGTCCDPDGNNKCPSKICLGGEVPKSYYFKNKKGSEGGEGLRTHLKSLILPKTGKEVFELDVEKPGTELRWEFQSDDFDVGFGISRVLPTGEEEVLLFPQRVNSHLVPEEGSLICTDPGTYKITFDNEFSYIRSKKLYYNLQLFPPTEHTKF